MFAPCGDRYLDWHHLYFFYTLHTIGRLQKGRGDKQNDRGVHGGENAKRRRRSVA